MTRRLYAVAKLPATSRPARKGRRPHDFYLTVNVTVLVVPIGVVTLTVRADKVAVLAMTKLALTVVEPVTERPLTVMPFPDTVIPVAPVKLVPVSVTATVVPCVPEVGLMEVRVGLMMVKDCDEPVPAL